MWGVVATAMAANCLLGHGDSPAWNAFAVSARRGSESAGKISDRWKTTMGMAGRMNASLTLYESRDISGTPGSLSAGFFAPPAGEKRISTWGCCLREEESAL